MVFSVTKLAIPDVLLIEAKRFPDDRGFFTMTYKQSDFAEIGINELFVQDNHSQSKKNVLRGLHYQNAPAAQGKLLTVAAGKIYDVAVDIRKESPTYGQWTDVVLSSERTQMLYIPPGFAHGFCVLSDEADLLYKVTAEYAPECEAGIVWNDPELGIKWPVDTPLLSGKDAVLPPLSLAIINF